jgi:hypothetical protein
VFRDRHVWLLPSCHRDRPEWVNGKHAGSCTSIPGRREASGRQ